MSRSFALPLILCALVLPACVGVRPGTNSTGSWSGAPAAASPARPPEGATPGHATGAWTDPARAEVLAGAAAWIDAARAEAAPDRRTARFDVSARDSLGRVFLVGETTDGRALDALTARLAERWPGAVTDAVRRLPDTTALGPLRLALVSVSVANLRADPRESAELASQALLGTPLRILDRRGGWLLVQTPDRYLAWVDASTVERVDARQMRRHEAARKLVYTAAYGFVRAEPHDAALPVSDLVAGSLLEPTDLSIPDAIGIAMDSAGTAADAAGQGGFVSVRLPDGRSGYVRADETMPFDDWADTRRTAPLRLVATAESFTGLPYLWGGTSTKGVDCSGFTRTVYLMNGMLLPRDASQQVRAGATVDSTGEWARLQPGDLLFFGRRATDGQPERVVHVGMWIGDGRFIHSSGRVRVSSMNPADADYGAYDRGRYLRTQRVEEGDRLAPLLRHGALYAVVNER